MTRSRLRLKLAVLTILSANACAFLPVGPRAIPECEGPLLTTEKIAGDFAIQQRWRVTAEGVDFPLQGLLEKRGDELVLIGVNAFGAKLFALVQTGTDIKTQAAPAALLPVPPQNLLRDLHRMLFLTAAPPPSGTGDTWREQFGERVFESWQGGKLLRRDFLRDRDSSVRLEFSLNQGREQVRLANPGCGYVIEITSISEQRL